MAPSAWMEWGGRWVVLANLRECGPWLSQTWRSVVRATHSPVDSPVSWPFVSGWIGWFGYEAAGWFDTQPEPCPGDGALPEVWLGRADASACYDRRRKRWFLSGDPASVRRLAAVVAGAPELSPAGPPGGHRVYAEPAQRYRDAVNSVLQHLRAGDCYQVNVARRYGFRGVGDAFSIWRRLNAANPSRRGVLVETPAGSVVSNSPELLLSVRGRRVRSSPIKGTAPRTGTAVERTSAAVALLKSAKERAELTMIVDLVRADLGRVAVPGSIVAGPRRVGPIGHVWHAAQPVEADLDGRFDALDCFAAVFPAGSVTGAPRSRAMQVIHALERQQRGVYCGAVGCFGDDGSARWSVAIRTITVRDDAASFFVGAGIVIGSDPEREYQETRLKAAKMAESLVDGPVDV